MSFMLFIGPIIGVAVAIIAAVVIISVIAAAVSQKDINDLQSDIFKYLLQEFFFLFFLFLWLYSALCYLYNLV